MSRVCETCGYWIDYIPALGWIDEFEFVDCFDEDLNYQGEHFPED